MNERPDPAPEGTLIAQALRRSGLSARQAAIKARISDGRWHQIVKGYQNVGAGEYARVRGPAETVARMADVVGVTPAQLIDAGRPDAAQALDEIQSREVPRDQTEGDRKIQELIDYFTDDTLTREML